MSDSLGQYILSRARQLGLSRAELCRRAGVSRQTLYTLMDDSPNLPSLSTMIAVANALHAHPIRLLQLMCDDHPDLISPPRQRRVRGDESAFVRDVTYPDGELVLPGQRVEKIWELQNVGTVTWENRFLQCMDEEIVVYRRDGETLHLAQNLRPDATRIPVPVTEPGEVVQLKVNFTAPTLPGTSLSYWRSVYADGSLCLPKGTGVWVKVVVTSLQSSSERPN